MFIKPGLRSVLACSSWQHVRLTPTLAPVLQSFPVSQEAPMVISNRELPSVLAGNYAINPTTLQLMFADAEEFSNVHHINSVISSLPARSPGWFHICFGYH